MSNFKEKEDKRICPNEPMSSKELVEIFLKRLNVEKVYKESDIILNWNKKFGKEFKGHIKIKEIKLDTLILKADHPAWAQKANMKKNTILRKIKKEFPSTNIKSIQIICR